MNKLFTRENMWKIIATVGVAGIVAICALIIAVAQLWQAVNSQNEQNKAQATEVAFDEAHLNELVKIVTLQAQLVDEQVPASTATAISAQIAELQSTIEANNASNPTVPTQASLPASTPPTRTPVLSICPSVLEVDNKLQIEQYLCSPNGRFDVKLQTDGNFVLYRSNGEPIWATNTMNSKAEYIYLQRDGNLVLHTDDGVPVWASQTASSRSADNYILKLQDDGNLVIYINETPIWETGANP